MDKTLRRILKENSGLNDKMDNMCDTLFMVSNTRVVPTDRPGDNNMFIVVKITQILKITTKVKHSIHIVSQEY